MTEIVWPAKTKIFLALSKKTMPSPGLRLFGAIFGSTSLCPAFLSVEVPGKERKFKEILRVFLKINLFCLAIKVK